MNEVWKPLIYKSLDLTDMFEISQFGNIKNVKTGTHLRYTVGRTGYYQVCVSLGSRNVKKVIKPHIAVALTFVDGYAEGFVVNHKDGNKLNNCADNLEWITQKENIKHAYDLGLFNNKKQIVCEQTGKVFDSIKSACEWCGLKSSGSLRNHLYGCSTRKPQFSAGKHPITKEPLTWHLI